MRRDDQTSRKRLAAVPETVAPTIAPKARSAAEDPVRIPVGDDERPRGPTRSGTSRHQLVQLALKTSITPPANAPPMRPCNRPSSMNGRRMNQFVAPTSFITSISRRRAYIAVRIVFQISSTVDTRRNTVMINVREPDEVAKAAQHVDLITREHDRLHPR